MFKRDWNSRTATYLLMVTITGFVITEVLLSLTPPISRDALIHHLAIPKLWLLHGGFYEMPWAEFSYYPMNIDLLYLVSLSFHNDIAPKVIHLLFGLGTGMLLYSYLKNRFGHNWGLLGFLIFFSTPVVVNLSTTAYVDLGMTFFTTASILALVKWRDGGCSSMTWLLLSALCMGLAAGSKYNAMIAWCFLNLMVVFYYSRERGRGVPALGFGAVFFIVAFLLVSPWYVKNYILTANPIYPLFDTFFTSLHNGGDGIVAAAGNKMTAGIFQRREMMFGEGFLETLMVPLRIFFQGKDGSAQYFDGVMNPLLVVMLPFAFLGKNRGRDNALFLSFSLFYLLTACFLTVIRVRYILPIIPTLAILSVMGIKNSIEWTEMQTGKTRQIGRIGMCVIVIMLVTGNCLYLKDYFRSIQPVGYILNQETRDDFLSRHLGNYPAVRYVNENLPDDARICLIFLGRRGYYLDRVYRHDQSFGMNTISSMVEASKNRKEFRTYLQSMHSTHVLLRIDLLHKYLQDNYQEETIITFLNRVREYWNPIYESNGYGLYELPVTEEY